MILPLDRHVPSRVHSASIVRRGWHQLSHRDDRIDGEHEMALFHPFDHLNGGDMCLNLAHLMRYNLQSDGSKVANCQIGRLYRLWTNRDAPFLLQNYKGVTSSYIKTDRNVVYQTVDFLYFGQRYCFSYNDGFKRELSGELFNYLNAVKIMICFLSINI